MDASAILKNIQDQHLGAVYVLEGEEPLYIDRLMKAFEEKALPPEARDFNQTILYGNEVDWKQVISEARRMPMFGDRTLILLKEGNQMKTLNDLAAYLEQPNPSTTLVIEVKGKKIDKRSKFYKLIKSNANHFESPKIKDDALPSWIQNYGKEIGMHIDAVQAEKLSMYLGNDLLKIANEFDKIKISEPGINTMTPELIEKYIGISREFSLFELTDTFFAGNTQKLASMLNYFRSDPKNVVLPLVMTTFYTYLSRSYTSYYVQDFGQQKKYGIWAQHVAFQKKAGLFKIHKLLMILGDFSKKTVGMNTADSNPSHLLTEMIGKMQLIMNQ